MFRYKTFWKIHLKRGAKFPIVKFWDTGQAAILDCSCLPHESAYNYSTVSNLGFLYL